MVIDTTSREGMESSLANLMGVSVQELYQYIEAAMDSAIEGQWCFNQDLFDKAITPDLICSDCISWIPIFRCIMSAAKKLPAICLTLMRQRSIVIRRHYSGIRLLTEL